MVNAALTFRPIRSDVRIWPGRDRAIRHAFSDGRADSMRAEALRQLAMADPGTASRFRAFVWRQVAALAGFGAVLRAGASPSPAWPPGTSPIRASATPPTTPSPMRWAIPARSLPTSPCSSSACPRSRRCVPAVIWALPLRSRRAASTACRARAGAWFGASLLLAGDRRLRDAARRPGRCPTGLGGVFGDMVLKIPGAVHRRLSDRPGRQRASPSLLAGPGALAACCLRLRPARAARTASRTRTSRPRASRVEDDAASFDDDEDERRGHPGASARSPIGGCRRAPSCAAGMARRSARDDDFDRQPTTATSGWRRPPNGSNRAEQRRGPGQRRRPRARRAGILRRRWSPTAPSSRRPDDDDDLRRRRRRPRPADVGRADDAPIDAQVQSFRSPTPAQRASRRRRRARRPAPASQREAQTSLIGPDALRDAVAALPGRAEERRARSHACRRTRWSRMPACWKACWRISASRARSSTSAPARSSRSTNWSRRPASSRRASSALPTTSPAR